MSVPYALYSGSSGNSSNGVADNLKLGKGFTMKSSLSPTALNLYASINYCINLDEGGYTDWRLPTYDEVMDYLSASNVGLTASDEFRFRTVSNALISGTSGQYLFIIYKNPLDENLVVTSVDYIATQKCNCVR
jgi:hypothetical protein